MADSYVQLPADSTGKKLRTRQRTVGANTVEEQAVYSVAPPTYYYWTGFNASAQNKIFIDIFNASGSGRIVRVRKLYLALNMAAQTGVAMQFDVDRTSAVGTGGTALTVNKADTADANLPAQITSRHAPTGGATKSGGSLFSFFGHSEETLAAAPFWNMINWIPEGVEIKEPTFREGEGFRVIQITTSTAGVWGLLAVIGVDDA